MRYATVCSGVEAMSLAVKGMGWEPVYFSEIEPFPCAVLAHHYPNVPNLGDMTKIEGENYDGTVDVFAGGTPCQAFSVAGKQQGIKDARGNLMLHFAKLAYEQNARWVVWENVPGVFSTNGGQDFAVLLSMLCGYDVAVPAKGWKNSGVVENAEGCYGVAWRVLDAQFTRVPGFERAIPQRRRRVWVVGYLGDWRRAAEVLFVSESVPWHPPACGGEEEGAAEGTEGCARTASGKPFTSSQFGQYIEGTGTLRASGGDLGGGSETPFCMAHGQANAEISKDASPTLTVLHEAPIIACATKQQGQNIGHDVAKTIAANDYKEPRAVCYENHAQDSRVKDCGSLSPTISAKAGTGGGNLPLVKEPSVYFERRMVRTTGGQPQDNVSACLRADANTGDGAPCVAIQGNMIGRSADAGPGGKGHDESGAMFTLTKTDVHAVAIVDAIHGAKSCNGKGWGDEGSAYTLDTMATQGAMEPIAVGVHQNASGELRTAETAYTLNTNGNATGRNSPLCLATHEVAGTMLARTGNAGGWSNSVDAASAGLMAINRNTRRVRRLTPRSCEKLMGFPPDYTKIPWRNKSPEDCPDAPRYKACGNSWAVNCARWVMMRIQQVEDVINKENLYEQ